MKYRRFRRNTWCQIYGHLSWRYLTENLHHTSHEFDRSIYLDASAVGETLDWWPAENTQYIEDETQGRSGHWSFEISAKCVVVRLCSQLCLFPRIIFNGGFYKYSQQWTRDGNDSKTPTRKMCQKSA
jgi:hypothetical protein